LARILVVDDEAGIRLVLSRFLLACGHDVVVASSGSEAMTVLRNSTVDLLITDVNMPEMDGFEVLIESLRTSRSVPVIVISGGGLLDKESLLDSARMLRAAATIEKPLNLAMLRVTVERLLRASTSDAGSS